MNSDQFLAELATVFDKQPKPQQLGIYRDKLRRFSPEQLLEILNKVLEEAKYFPKVSEIFKAAEALGYLSVTQDTRRFHHWKETNCGLCHGEGRIAIIWHCFTEERGEYRAEIQELVQVFQYSKSFDYRFKPNECRSIFRCRCLAGDAESLPKAWPKWTNNSNARREVWG